MILDKERMFAEAQAITATAASENVLDMLNTVNRVGEPYKLIMQVDESFDSGADDGTLAIALQSDSAAAFSSAKTIWTMTAIAEATLVADYNIPDIPLVPVSTERYLRLYFTVAGSGNLPPAKLRRRWFWMSKPTMLILYQK